MKRLSKRSLKKVTFDGFSIMHDYYFLIKSKKLSQVFLPKRYQLMKCINLRQIERESTSDER